MCNGTGGSHSKQVGTDSPLVRCPARWGCAGFSSKALKAWACPDGPQALDRPTLEAAPLNIGQPVVYHRQTHPGAGFMSGRVRETEMRAAA